MAKVRVDPRTGCWLWTAALDRGGYGKLYVDGKYRIASRLSYELHHGAIPDGMSICHRCDTPACVNPGHLFVGTKSDNMRDASRKGRANNGSTHYAASLTAPQVREIVARLAAGERGRHIAAHYGVLESTVSNIKHGRKYVTEAGKRPRECLK